MGTRKARLLAAVVLMTLTASYVRAEILIAAAGPMSGPYSFYGEQMKRGAEMAVADLNAKGGLIGQRLRLMIVDDACGEVSSRSLTKKARNVANKVVREGAMLVAGHFCSGSSIPASGIYQDADILQISPASSNPKLTEQGADNVFRVWGRDDRQGIVAGDMLADEFGTKKIAILHNKSGYGKGLAEVTKKQLSRRGVQEVMYKTYRAGQKNFSSLIGKMKAAGVEAVYVGGFHTEVGRMIRQAHERHYKPQFVSGDAMATDEFWQATGPAGEGTLVTFGPDPRNKPQAAEVVEMFRAQNYEPEGYTLYTYGAVQVWAQAVEKAGTTDLDKVIAALRANQFDTVLGSIGFDDKGDVTGPSWVWYVWQNGNIRER
jgi:branched-chain amino acid transport system substrate-binding protein